MHFGICVCDENSDTSYQNHYVDDSHNFLWHTKVFVYYVEKSFY